MIPRTRSGAAGWLDIVLEGLQTAGCAIVEGAVGEELLAAAGEGLLRAQKGVEEEVGIEHLRRAREVGVLRLPMRFDGAFFRFLSLPEVLAVVDHTVSPTAILHLQNGLVLPPAGCDDREVVPQLEFHIDFGRVLNGYLCSVNTLFAIDEFREDNGSTLLVPGTHQQAVPPDREDLRRRALPAVCPAGSMVVFDSTLWHAAGANRTARPRRAINQQFTRSYFKQQIDYVRALGDDAVLAQPPRTQQLLGWYTRVVTSLDEFYRAPAERLYRADQG